MFVSQHVSLPVTPGMAQARLAMLATDGYLGNAARTAYEAGVEQIIRLGPFGNVPWSSKLVRVLFLEPVRRDNIVTIGMRWEATGISGKLFPVLDANIIVVASAADDTAILMIEGAYRPPFGGVGASLDRVLLNKVATATVLAMLRDIAAILASPSEDAVP